MPRFMFLIKADAMAESFDECTPPPKTDGPNPFTKMFEDMAIYNEKLSAANVLVDLGGFTPTKDAFRIKYTADKEAEAIAGPFDVTTEAHVCGFWIIETKDMQEAIGWAKQVPFPSGELVIRKMNAVSDMDGVSDDIKDRETKLCASLKTRKSNA